MLRGAVKGGGKVEEVSRGAGGEFLLFGAQFHLSEVHAQYPGCWLGAGW